ncbi:MAG TPA: hypothetical protein VHN55_00715 [Sphingomicrobium sp.]|nr:hypothetical protein [Sphingomicrobium sp.]
MAIRIAGAAVFLLAGCTVVDDSAVPESPDIQRLEKQLAQHPCVGGLDGWQRNYRFSRKTGLFSPYSLSPDLDVIEFHLRRARTVTIAPGLNVLPPEAGGNWPDSQAIQTVDGRYRLTDGSLKLAPCNAVPGN